MRSTPCQPLLVEVGGLYLTKNCFEILCLYTGLRARRHHSSCQNFLRIGFRQQSAESFCRLENFCKLEIRWSEWTERRTSGRGLERRALGGRTGLRQGSQAHPSKRRSRSNTVSKNLGNVQSPKVCGQDLQAPGAGDLGGRGWQLPWGPVCRGRGCAGLSLQ